MKQRIKIFPLLVYLYMAMPFFIFSSGFLKWYFAVPFSLLTVAAALFASFSSEGYEKIAFEKKDCVKLAIGAAVIILAVLFSGIGGFFWQNTDHSTRNTIFNILVSDLWPPVRAVNGSFVGLVYYIGFWLPAAVVGKLFSLSAGYVFQVVWAVLGILIIWLLICTFHKKIVLYPLFIFLFFSGADIIGYKTVTNFFSETVNIQLGKWASFGDIPFTYHIEWWPRYYQYSSNMTQLFWVFNQALPCWVATMALLAEKNNKNLVLILGLSLISSTLPFVGLIPIFVWCAVTEYNSSFSRPLTKTPLKDFISLFTFQNVLGGGISGIISFIYLKENISAETAGQNAAPASTNAFTDFKFYILLAIIALFFFGCYKADKKKIRSYLILPPLLVSTYLFASLPEYKEPYFLIFIIFDLLLIAAALFPAYGQTSLYYVAVLSLLIIPFFKVGASIDFCMRASVPALFVLSVLAGFAVSKYIRERRIIPLAAIILVLLIGSVTPAHEIARTFLATRNQYAVNGKVINREQSESTIFEGKNFTGNTQDSVFFEIFAK